MTGFGLDKMALPDGAGDGPRGFFRAVGWQRHTMFFLARILMVIGIVAGLGYAALYAFAVFVEPEQRDIVLTIPTPKPKP